METFGSGPEPGRVALEDQRIVDLAETDPLGTTIDDQLPNVADNSIDLADDWSRTAS